MLTIAGGIVLGFFAIIIILAIAAAFGEAIIEAIGNFLVLALFLAALGIIFYVISLLPYAKDVIGWMMVIGIFGFLGFGALVSLHSAAKGYLKRFGMTWGTLIACAFLAVPTGLAYLLAQPTKATGQSEFFWLAIGLTVIWGVLVLWVVSIIQLVRRQLVNGSVEDVAEYAADKNI